MSRGVLYILPLLTVLVVSVAVFVVGAPRAYLGVRLWGGPAHATDTLALHLELVERYDPVEQPAAPSRLHLELRSANGITGNYDGTISNGRAEVTLALPGLATPPFTIRVLDVDRGLALAEGTLHSDPNVWKHARRRGGWIEPRRPGALSIRVAPERGALAVPFREPLLIEVRHKGAPLPGAKVTLDPSGLQLDGPDQGVTDSQGRCRFLVKPTGHAVTLGVQVEGESGETATWHSSLSVVPGALWASIEGQNLLVVSPVPRDEGFYMLTDGARRLSGGRLALTPQGDGTARAVVPLPQPTTAAWAVVGSDPDLAGDSAVGWPIGDHQTPQTTFDAPEQLLLDGMRLGYERNQRRMSRARWLAVGFVLCALALAMVLLVRNVQRTDREIEERLAPEFSSDSAGRLRSGTTWLSTLVALLCLGLGFGIVALWGLYRLH